MTGDNERRLTMFSKDFAIYQEIGIIATSWATLELVVDHSVWDFAEVGHSAGACITGNMPSIFPKMDALIALSELREVSKHTIKKLTRIKNEMHAVAEQRNFAVHSAISSFENEDGEVLETIQTRIKSRGGREFGTVPITKDELSKVSHRIHELHLKFISGCVSKVVEIWGWRNLRVTRQPPNRRLAPPRRLRHEEHYRDFRAFATGQ